MGKLFTFIFLLLLTVVFLSSIFGCASEPEAETFVADWEFVDRPGMPTKACLSQDEVGRLREALIRCKASK